MFLSFLKHATSGWNMRVEAVDEFVARFLDHENPLRTFFNGLGALCGGNLQRVWMATLHNLNSGTDFGWAGPALSKANDWQETGSYVCRIVRLWENRDLQIYMKPNQSADAWRGGVCGDVSTVLAHPNEMSNEMAFAMRTDFTGSFLLRHQVGGSCCVWNFGSQYAVLPKQGLRVTFSGIYRRHRDGMLVADKWTIWAEDGCSIFSIKAGLLCSDPDCSTWQASRINQIERFRHHHPRRFKTHIGRERSQDRPQKE